MITAPSTPPAKVMCRTGGGRLISCIADVLKRGGDRALIFLTMQGCLLWPRLEGSHYMEDKNNRGLPTAPIQTPDFPRLSMIRFVQIAACAIGVLANVATAEITLAQQPLSPNASPEAQAFAQSASGSTFLSQFANPALRGSLFLTPQWPMTGYYPLFPGGLAEALPTDGVLVGPLRLNPQMGVAQMFTDNVFRTNANKVSDFVTSLAPGIQARLPFAGFHSFLIDYRTNIQYYSRTPSNNVQDQTATGGFKFNFPGGLNIDLQGHHKLGHDPRGSAVDDTNTQGLGVNKWTANGFTGQAEYLGAQSSVKLTAQTIRWDYLNNGLGPLRDRLTNSAGLTLARNVTGKTSLLVNFSTLQSIFDQNKNLDNVMYTISGGGTWNVTELTSGEILVGYQHVQFTNAQVNQPPPLSQFLRDKDSYSNFYFMGRVNWQATPLLKITLQPYRTIQQTVTNGSLFFTATGVNLTGRHELTDNTTINLNLGYEENDFQSSGSGGTNRTDHLKNVALGVTYRAVNWVGLGIQYIFEDRNSNQSEFTYQANTVMFSAQALL
jgi:Putative beta-barrel porin 2